MNNLRQIAMALRAYESMHGELPPAYTVDAAGRRLHSWRTLILPYIDQQPLYDSIDLTKAWDDPANVRACEAVVDLYQCPSAATRAATDTTYLAVVGAEFAFTGSTPRKLADILGESSATLLVIDARTAQSVHWMSPHDTTEVELLAAEADSREMPTQHPGVVHAAFVEGTVLALPADIDTATLHGLLTIAGGEDVGIAVERPAPTQPPPTAPAN